MSTSARGNAAENFVAASMRSEGWTVGSMRHGKGGGDLIAIHPARPPKLVECKKAPKRGVLFGGGYFSREQRQDMRDTPRPHDTELWLAWVKGSGQKREITWIAESEWP